MRMIVVILVIAPLYCFAESVLPQVSCNQSEVPLFRTNEIADITLKGDFPVTTQAAPAEIKYVNKESKKEVSIPVQVVQRGKSRAWLCVFKPVRVLWGPKKKENVKGTIFEHVKGKDMKLTAHCHYASGTIEDYQEKNEIVLKEYMIYKMLRAFGLPSYDVRLAKAQYVDQNDQPKVQGYGFFIESSAQLEDRCGLIHAKRDEVLAAVGPTMNKQVLIPYLFARLISDARDYVVDSTGGHNAEPFLDVDKVTRMIVPYDFNDSGQVNSGIAPYWSFTPDTNLWFTRLRQGPFTRDGFVVALNQEESERWKTGVEEMAAKLIARKADVLKEIDESPLQQASKDQYHAHVEMLMTHFQKIVDNQPE